MFKKLGRYSLFALFAVSGLVAGCDKETKSINVFTLEDDKTLGDQVVQQIESDPTIHVLDTVQYATAYGHLNRIVNNILNCGLLVHRNDFTWRVRIIQDDTTLNAFCAPGGKIYVYSGIIKYLDGEDELAGVLGHEMAHADRRHVTDEMTKQYGIQVLLDITLGKNQGALTQVAQGLVGLKFSRDKEAEADKYSVMYLNATEYDPLGVGKFFTKLINAGQGDQGPAFLSDHPSPDDRVENIHKEWEALGSKTGGTFTDRYQDFKNSLP
jgi:predicted Zn-dependent protease